MAGAIPKAILVRKNNLEASLDDIGVNEIRPKYNRSHLENEAFYKHGTKQVKYVGATWANTTGTSFDGLGEIDNNRRKAKSVLRTIPSRYEDEIEKNMDRIHD